MGFPINLNKPLIDTAVLSEAHQARLQFMAAHICQEAPQQMERLLEYWRTTFPECRDYEQLRDLGQAFRDNQWQPLRSIWVDSSVELDQISSHNPILLRIYDGKVFLREDEAVVVYNRQMYGPLSKEKAHHLEHQLSAASPTHTPEGYTLSPDMD